MKVHVLAKLEFDNLMKVNEIVDKNVEKYDNIMLISIMDTHSSEDPWFEKNHSNVINLSFDDVEEDMQGAKAFSEAQARKLFKFIDENKEKESCIVHCSAGISRSGAVGTFVNGYCGGDWELFKRTNPWISPNARVSRMLNDAERNV